MFKEHLAVTHSILAEGSMPSSIEYRQSITKTVRTRCLQARQKQSQSPTNTSALFYRELKSPECYSHSAIRFDEKVGSRFRHAERTMQEALQRINNAIENKTVVKNAVKAFELFCQSVKGLEEQLERRVRTVRYLEAQLKTQAERLEEQGKEIAKLTEARFKWESNAAWLQRKREGLKLERREQLERMKLEKLRLELEDKLGSISELKRVQQLQGQLEQERETFRSQIEKLKLGERLVQDQLKLREQKIRTQKDELQKSVSEAEAMGSLLAAAQEDRQRCLNEQSQSRERYRLLFERHMMTLEDKLGSEAQHSFLAVKIVKLGEINRALRKQLMHAKEKEKDRAKDEVEFNPFFEYQRQFFSELRGQHRDRMFHCRRKETQAERPNIGLLIFDPEVDYQPDPDDRLDLIHDIDIHNFAYYKPTFFSLLQVPDRGRDSASKMGVSELVTYIHYIFDSKHKEFVLGDDPEKYSQFPEFVYSWFSTFTVDAKSGRLATIADKKKAYAHSKMTDFYRDLMSKNYDHIWEVVTFREFLIEHLSLEEVYFYLSCRSTLFSIARILPEKVRSESRIFVGFSHAVQLMEVVLDNYEAWSINFIKEKAKSKVIKRKSVQIIDSNYVLRCLLEFYRIERINRLKFIRKQCQKCSGSSQTISFDGFLELFDSFQGVSVLEKVRLYRECFSVSHGNITADAIYTVLTERSFFLKHLRLSSQFKFPVHKGKRSLVEEDGLPVELTDRTTYYLEPYLPALYEIYKTLKCFFKYDSDFYQRLEGQGLDSSLTAYGYFRHLINKNRFLIESSALRGRHFVHFISGFSEEIKRLAFSNFYRVLEASKQPLSRYGEIHIDVSENELIEAFSEEMRLWSRLFQWTEEMLSWKRRVNEFRVNYCAKKIQRRIREKLLKPYLDIYGRMISKVESNKSVIIAELKKKYKKN